MKRLFIGGIKSGKSKNAEDCILHHYSQKPLYLATNEFFDEEMKERVAAHKRQRKEQFSTLEEPLLLAKTLTNAKVPVLVECVSMWINNMLYHKRDKTEIFQEIHTILALKKELVFVINDVSCSVVSEYKSVREFVDINSQVAQLLASGCDEVYTSIAGISVQIK